MCSTTKFPVTKVSLSPREGREEWLSVGVRKRHILTHISVFLDVYTLFRYDRKYHNGVFVDFPDENQNVTVPAFFGVYPT